MTDQAKTQLNNPMAMFVASGILILMGMVPGMPHFIFLTLGFGAGAVGLMLANQTKVAVQLAALGESTQATEEKSPSEELDWDDVDQVDLVGLDIGYGLIPLVNTETGGQLLPRVKGVRKKLSAELGFLVQPIRIRDNLDLAPDVYHIVMNGVVRGKGEIKVGREMAINPCLLYTSPSPRD